LAAVCKQLSLARPDLETAETYGLVVGQPAVSLRFALYPAHGGGHLGRSHDKRDAYLQA